MDLKNNYFLKLFVSFLLLFSLVSQPLQIVAFATETEELEVTENQEENTESTVNSEVEEVGEEAESTSQPTIEELEKQAEQPLELTVIGKTHNSITIEWNTSAENIEYYKVFLEGEEIAEVDNSVNQYVVKELDYNHSYNLEVRAYVANSDQEIDSADIWDYPDFSEEEKEQAIPESDFQLDIQVVDVKSDQISITWASSHDTIESYGVYVDSERIATVDSDIRDYTIEGLNENEYYWIMVVADAVFESDGYYRPGFRTESIGVETNWSDETINSAIDGSTFQLDFEVISTNSSSITVAWQPNDENVQYYELYLDGKYIAKVDADVKEYTFVGLQAGEEYELGIEANGLFKWYNGEKDNYWIDESSSGTWTYERAYWADDELIPVSLMFIFNDDPKYSERYRIRGLDEENKNFDIDEYFYESDGELNLPLGKYELLIYDENELSISHKLKFEIKENVNYKQNPIQLKVDLLALRKEAQPFKFEVTDVKEDSFILKWNDISKIMGYQIIGYDKDGWEHSFTIDEIEKGAEGFKVTGLKSNYTYSINLLTNYLHDLNKNHYFNLKTLGQDAEAKSVVFTDEQLKKIVSEDLGIYKRDVTEADIEELIDLYVYSEGIEDLTGLEFASNLEYIEADYNRIKNIDVLQGKEELYSLSLSGNQLSTIKALENLVNLEYLYLEGNEIQDLSPLKDLVKLINLRLDSNQLTDVSSLADLTQLTNLELGYNEINTIDALQNLINLEYLHLPGNKINNINALQDLINLETIYLSNNEINNIDALKDLKNVRSLYLSSNQIQSIDGLTNLSNLRDLSLGDNQIDDISILKNLHQLEYLNLSQNSIQSIDGITQLSSLERIYLDNNEIETLPSLEGMTALEELWIYSNNIVDISGLKGLDNVRYIDLDNNPISDISVLLELPSLESVSLYGTDVKDEEMIRKLRDSGIEVYHDLDDWNDWEDEEDDEEVEVDLEEILEAFPEDSGFTVDENGEVSLDLSNNGSDEKLTLTPEQTSILIKNNRDLNISKGEEVQLSIPSNAFDNSDEPVEINVNELENVENSLSKTYDFTIKQGDRTISQFDEGITLTFDVTPNKNTKTKNLKVYYYNEETKKWEKIGGTFNNGKVTVVTYHFSKFTVLEEKDINELFTSQAGYVVDDEYSTIITYQLSHSNEFVLSPEQLQRLHEDEDQIHFYLQGESFAFVPYYSDLNVEEELKVTFKEIENTKNDLSNTFDIQLNQKDMSGNSYIGKLDLGLKRKLSKGETVNLYELIGNKWVKTLRDDVQSIASEDVQAYIPNNGTFTVFASDADEIELEEEVNPNPDLDGSEDEESNETDIEGILSVFPKDSGFIVSQVGTISFDLMNKESTEKVELTPEQITILIKNKLALIITKGEDVQLSIPSTVFDNSDEKVEIHVKEIEKTKDSLSKTYDFTIKQGERTISQFDEGITLTFDVIPNKNTNTENLKVFYLNEKTGKWEKVGGTFKDGKVTAVTNHFSQFTVFDEAEVEDEMNPTPNPEQKPDPTPNPTPDSESSEQNTDSKEESVPEKSEIDNEKNNDDKEQNIPEESDGVTKDQDKISTQKNEKESEKNELPNTATNVMNYMLIGFILILTASTVLFIRRKRL